MPCWRTRLSTSPGYCPQASLASAKVAREGTRAPSRSLEVRGHCGTFFLKEAARRHDSGLSKSSMRKSLVVWALVSICFL